MSVFVRLSIYKRTKKKKKHFPPDFLNRNISAEKYI